MFQHIITAFQDSETPAPTKRRAERRSNDACVSVINGKTYPVENWSMGGLLVFGDVKVFSLNNNIDLTLKFKLRDRVIEVPHKAKIIRKTYDRIALEFFPLTNKLNKALQSVIDDQVASQFAESQLT